jgi:hypothetical protein
MSTSSSKKDNPETLCGTTVYSLTLPSEISSSLVKIETSNEVPFLKVYSNDISTAAVTNAIITVNA